MKKIVIVTLILILSIGLVGCHRLSKEESDPSDNAKTQEEHSTEENKSSDDQDISLEPDTKYRIMFLKNISTTCTDF